jgi:hypothetical protein
MRRKAMTSLRPALLALRCLLVAVLFAACGAFSARFFPEGGDKPTILVVPLPFAVLRALLLWRGAKTLWLLPLMLLAWLVAHYTAQAVGMVTGVGDRFTAVAVGGCIGGLGVALSVSKCEGRLRTCPYLLLAAVVGGVSALAFGPWVRNYNLTLWNADWKYLEFQPLRLRYAFAIWQAAVGTYLYLACNGQKRRPVPTP